MKMKLRKRLVAALLFCALVLSAVLPGYSHVQAAEEGGEAEDGGDTQATEESGNSQAEEDFSWLHATLLLMGVLEDTLPEEELDSYITRAEFAKLLVDISTWKDKVEDRVTSSLYSDVRASNAYAGYIKLVVGQNLMTGYVDGTFRPQKGVQLKVAAKAVLGLLGYASSDFTGNKVTAQVSKFNSLDLNENINKTQNKYLTWRDCLYLAYQLMSTETKEGKLYGETLGYPMNAEGEISYLSMLKEDLSGPVLAEGDWRDTLPVDLDTALIYRNEVTSSKEVLQDYDVIYYSKKANVIWAYDNKVTGMITAVSPNRVSPERITVANQEFTLGTQRLIYDFSSLGKYRLKQTITLFLGMNDEVAAVRTPEEYSTDVYGVVLRTGTEVSTDTSDPNIVNEYMVVVDINGIEHTYYYDSEELEITSNAVIHVAYDGSTELITKLSFDKTELSNSTVNAGGTRIGSRALANDVKILDVFNSSYVELQAEDIAGVKLYGTKILYYEFNQAGEICVLFLNNVSGGSYSYGVVTAASPNKYNPTSYMYMVDGVERTVSTNNMYGAGLEGAACAITTYENGSIYMAALSGKEVTSITASTVKTSSWTKALSKQAQVYYKDKNGVYYQTTLDKVKNLSLYKVTAYYDQSLSVTNEVKVLVAEDK